MTKSAAMVDLPYCKPERDRHGRIAYWYFRRNGRRWRLPGEPLSPEWLAEYSRLKAETTPAPKVAPVNPITGSFKALVTDYYASPEFRVRAPGTQRIYRLVLDRLVVAHGHKPVALLERRHVKQWRDERADTPGMANMVVKIMNVLLMFAVDNNYRKDNPAAKLKLYKLGEHRAWTHEELAAFERCWPPGTMQRRAYALARYTGQRCGDVAAMTWRSREDGAIRVKQQKTGKTLRVREHSELVAELAHGGPEHISLLTKEDGSSFDSSSLSLWFAEAIKAAELPDDCVMHGLRKVAARDLAEAGCTEHEIASVTGQSLAEVERYTRAVNQRRLAASAIFKLEQNEKPTLRGKRRPGDIG